MRNNLSKKAKESEGELNVIRGGKDHSDEITQLVNAAWNFAYSALWNATHFSTKEITETKENIEWYFLLSKNPRRSFVNFCQRILLARNYVTSGKGRYIPLPSGWFDQDNETGFAGTKEWFDQIRTVRSSLPFYKEEIKALAEAVLEYSEAPTLQNFQFWRSYFIEKNAPGLLQLFQINAINQHYSAA